MSTSTYIAYSSEVIVQPIDVTFESWTGVTTLVGSTLSMDALNLKTAAKVSGTLIPSTATRGIGTIGPLVAGTWSVQATMTAPGGQPNVIWAATFVVKAGAAP